MFVYHPLLRFFIAATINFIHSKCEKKQQRVKRKTAESISVYDMA
jgi:hypothetical protein